MHCSENTEINMCNLSAIVIAKNEQDRIAGCLDSLAFCDEIIVVDNGSSDNTVRIAKNYKATVVSCSSESFSVLRMTGKAKARGTWIVYVDADEIVPLPLAKEITSITSKKYAQTDPVAYFITRQNYYLGKKWPVRDAMQRLFLKKSLLGWTGILHETAQIQGTIQTLKEPLIHVTHRTLEEMVVKTNVWSGYEAKLRYEANHPPVVWWRLMRVMWTGFSQSFGRGGGWKAGTVGWIESMYQGFSLFLTYAKLWEMQQKGHSDETKHTT